MGCWPPPRPEDTYVIIAVLDWDSEKTHRRLTKQQGGPLKGCRQL